MKLILNSSGLETDFSELKDHAVFHDSIKKCEILMEEAWHKQKGSNRYVKQIKIGSKSEKQTKKILEGNNEETMLLNL